MQIEEYRSNLIESLRVAGNHYTSRRMSIDDAKRECELTGEHDLYTKTMGVVSDKACSPTHVDFGLTHLTASLNVYCKDDIEVYAMRFTVPHSAETPCTDVRVRYISPGVNEAVI